MCSDRCRLGECTREQHAFRICCFGESEENYFALVEAVAAESCACARFGHTSAGEGIPSARMESKKDMEPNVVQLSNDVGRKGTLSLSIFFFAATAIGGVRDPYCYSYVLRVS